MVNRRPIWSDALLEKAIVMHDAGLSWREVADALGRTYRALDMALLRYRARQPTNHPYLKDLDGPAIGVCRVMQSFEQNARRGSASLRAQIERVFGRVA